MFAFGAVFVGVSEALFEALLALAESCGGNGLGKLDKRLWM